MVWYIASEGAWRLTDEEPFLSSRLVDVYSVDVGPDNVKWFGGNGVVWSYDDKTRTFYDLASQEAGLNIHKTVFGKHGEKWFLSDYYLLCYNGANWFQYDLDSHVKLPDDYTGEPLKSVDCAVDLDGVVWICMTGGYILSFDPYGATDVETNESKPEPLPLIRSFPNPFNPSTTIEFTLPEAGQSDLIIYNIAGQKVRELVSENMAAGHHTTVWDGRDDSGNSVSAGIYFARLTCGGMTTTGKMVMVK
ncbi:T9SS type A sorting domain-containing protein [bacterium]|nr:T9SS type A sorting domain-containing protein [bacterium]